MMKKLPIVLIASCALSGVMAQSTESLVDPQNYQNLVADRKAFRVGDALTVLIQEAAVASSSVDSRANRKLDLQLRGQITNRSQRSLDIGLDSGNEGGGEVARSGRVTGQITVTIQAIQTNGDLALAGEQTVDLNGEKQIISVSGRVRPRDITDNTVLSSRIADAQIAYTGQGYIADKSQPSWFSRLLGFIGL